MSFTCPCESRHKISNGEFSPADWRQFYIGPGAKIYGDIKIVDGIAIGTNAVVNESFLEPNITIAGIPAKKLVKKDRKDNLLRVPTWLKLSQIINKKSSLNNGKKSNDQV